MSDSQRTRIDSISQVGDELDEEQMRLASGGDYDLFSPAPDCLIAVFYSGADGSPDCYATSDPADVEMIIPTC
jgi:hypothetical protein